MATMQRETVEPVGQEKSRVLPRLLAYVKPHLRVAVLCLVLVLVVTALNLLRPILIGRAIDGYIEDYARPYYQVEPGTGELEFRGLSLSRAEPDTGAERCALMLYYGERYYFFTDLAPEAAKALREAAEEGLEGLAAAEDEAESLTVALPGGSYEGTLLSRADLALLRAGDFAGVKRIALVYALVLLVTVACSLSEHFLLQKMGQDIIYTVRQEVFSHVLTLPARWFDTNAVGRIVTRTTNDVEALNQLYTGVLIRLFSNAVLIVGYAVVMAGINWRLAMICFAFLPVIGGLTWWFRTLARRIYREVRTMVSSLNTFLSENISGMKLIQIFVREGSKAGEFRDRTEELYRAQMKELYIMSVFRPCIVFVSNLALALILWRSGTGVLAGTLTLGTMYVFTNYIRSFFDPIQEMAEHFSVMQNAFASAEKIFTVMDEENPIKEPEHPAEMGPIRGEIEFRHVWFAYEKEEYVLRDVSFKIHPGEKVAFVGATGAGKSSILNLIGRYYEIQKGEILVDGVNIRDIPTPVLRRAIGQVQQDVFIFTGDIKGNIRLLDESISDSEIREAARAVNADRFIDQLPAGYDEPVTERGSTLSAGQRQLLSFARTLAYRPTILVMDEATANIDTETEQLIQTALETLMRGRTTIMVAHRLSTVQHADNILVLHKGRIRESGTHQQLLEQGGIYKKLYELQQ